MFASKTFRRHGLSLVMGAAFLCFWGGQVVSGRMQYNEEREVTGKPPLGVGAYLHSMHFLEATMENWESEFLQMGSYVFLTAFLFQKGSAESNDPDGEDPLAEDDPWRKRNDPQAPWPVRRGGWVLRLYENSLGLAFLILFLGSMALHALGGSRLYSEQQLAHGHEAVSFLGYFATSQFWFESLQNWQSEFLAMVSMVLFSIFLRQRGSPESKSVAAPHSATGAEG